MLTTADLEADPVHRRDVTVPDDEIFHFDVAIAGLALGRRHRYPNRIRTVTTCPVMKAPPGPARNSTSCAMSCGVLKRPSGSCLPRLCHSSSLSLPRASGGSAGPGVVALTVAPERPRSSASPVL